MIKLEGISKLFGATKAVNNISFEVKEGENLVLLGTSGCGKTTTLRMINRLIDPSAGTISINGKDIKSQSPEKLRSGIGYVLQHNSLFPHYTVAENIAIVPNLLKWDKQKIKSRTEELMEKLQLPLECLTAYPAALSGGQQQRVNVARALAAYQPILLMDEPFGALDTITRTNIRKEFIRLDELRKKTIVMVTHDVQEAFELGDKICLMDKGHIVQIGTAGELLFKPVNEFVRTFFAENYLQLALQTVMLKSIWQELPVAGDAAVSVKTETVDTLWKIMEKMALSTEATSKDIVLEDTTGNKRVANWDTLMSIFNKNRGAA